MLLFLNRGTLAPFAREDRMGPIAARQRTGSEPPRRPRTGDREPGPGSIAATGSALPPGAVVLPSGAPAFPDQLLASARTVRGREGDRVLDELQAAWEALPVIDRVERLAALHELGKDAARDGARSWARRELRALLEGARLESALLLLEELARLEDSPEQARARASLVVALDQLRLPRALRRAVLSGLVRQGELAALPHLLDELGRREASDRRVGWDLLVALVGEPRPFEPDGPAARREQQVRAWRAWWQGAEGEALRAARRW